MKKILFLIILIAGFRLAPFAQEVITGLYENPVVRAEYEKQLSNSGIRGNSDEKTAITLPFFDDFSQSGIYPKSSRWIDQEAYINSNFGYRSVNVGVATLDAIDSKGKLHANASQFPFMADSLTSRLIRLDSVFTPSPRSITLADSLYFSFYYQPQGRAKQPPESRDSLILQFGYYTGDSIFAYTYDSIWVPVNLYITPGDTINPGDTVYSPADQCGNGLFVIASEYYFYDDLIQLPCDSIFVPEFKWQRIWSSKGLSLDDFYQQYGTYSKQVMIPVRDSIRYFKKDFQFRFINIASLASEIPSWRSNCDQWNIDFVYLNTGRSYKDTVYRMVSFVERAPSMLKNYESMPYNQYVNNYNQELKESLEMFITNLDSTIFNSTYYYVVYQVDGPFEYLYPGGNCNLFPFNINGYQNCISCAAHACPPVNFFFPLSNTEDSAEFEIRHFIIGDITPTDTVGDTVSFRQKFFNYYAYDDGTPEEGYGLTPAGSKLAYRFILNVKDTLRAVQMFFNHTQNDANQKFFNLTVWQDNNGKPGDVMYSQLNEQVEYSTNLLGYHTYMLNEPLPVNGTFYIGWEQQTGDNLNLGFDRYNNAQQNIFSNTTGQWYQSIYEGALMMRPLLGKPFDISGVDEHLADAGSIIPYPNPLNGSHISFRCTGKYENTSITDHFRVSVHNLPGEELYSGDFRQSLDIGRLSPGLYIIAIKNEQGQIISVSKLIKN